jgi:Spy/CpxP family protein refolding chaperone
MKGSKARTRTTAVALAIAFVLPLAATPGGAGEFKVSRYIEPNQMSNLFTRHVRKGIIKRIGLTEAQLYEIEKTVDPHRQQLLAQMTDLKDARIELVGAVAAEPFDPKRVNSSHSKAMSKELDLMMTLGIVVSEIRPILTEEQCDEVAEMMEEIRASSEVRFADFSEKLLAGELLGLKERTDPRK